jgi:hypothetical protein
MPRHAKKAKVEHSSRSLDTTGSAIAVAVMLPEQLYSTIFQYADSHDLCNIDATCTSFRSLTVPVWQSLALKKFGIDRDSGKKAWRLGKALTKPKHHFTSGS